MAKKKSQNKKNANLKWILAIFVIFILLTAFFYYKYSFQTYQQSNTQTISTNDWKTYEDSAHGFSIKYPEDWNHKEVNIEGGSYEGGTMLPDKSTRFYGSSEDAVQSDLTTKGNEKLYLRIINNKSINELSENKGIQQTTIAGKPAVKYSAGAYIELSSSPNVILSISSTAYPSPELEEILNSLAVN